MALSVSTNDPDYSLSTRDATSGMNFSGTVSPTTGGYANYQQTSTQPGYVATWSPQQQNTGEVDGAYTSGGSPSYDAGDLAYLDDQQSRLQSQFGRADNTLAAGLQKILASYNKEVSGANQQQSRFLQDIGTKREDTTRGKMNALNQTDTNARTLANSLRMMIGMAGGTDSSAYNINAPYAVSREASKNRAGVMENFGQNFRDLQTRQKRGEEDFASLLSDLAEQRRERQDNLRVGIDEQKNEISGNLAEIARQRALLLGGGYTQVRDAMSPYTQQISQREAAIDAILNRVTPFQAKAVDTTIPELRQYMVDRAAINARNQSGTEEQYAPYKQNLMKSDEEERLLV